jgi:hypothetical protein
VEVRKLRERKGETQADLMKRVQAQGDAEKKKMFHQK